MEKADELLQYLCRRYRSGGFEQHGPGTARWWAAAGGDQRLPEQSRRRSLQLRGAARGKTDRGLLCATPAA